MTFDVYPVSSNHPLTLQDGVPSALIPITERAAIDPVTGRNTMHVAVVKLGVGCSPPGPPDPILQLQVNTGPPTTIGDSTPLFAEPGGVQPVAIATVTHLSAPELHLLEIEVLQTGLDWKLRIEHSGPADSHDFTWVVADSAAETRRPWIDAPQSIEIVGQVGQRLTRDITIANRGTGSLALTDTDGADLQQGFTLDAVSPDSVPPNGCATATIAFTAPAYPGVRTNEHTVKSNDVAAVSDAGHNKFVRLRADFREPILQPGDIIDASSHLPSLFRPKRLVIRVDPHTGEQTRIKEQSVFTVTSRIAAETSGNVLLTGRFKDGSGGVARLDRVTGELTKVSVTKGNGASIAVEANGAILVSHSGDTDSHAIVRIDPVSGAQTLVTEVKSANRLRGLTIDRNGQILVLVSDEIRREVIRVNPANGLHTKVSSNTLFNHPTDIAVGKDGRILVADNEAAGGGCIIGVDPATGTQAVVSSGQFFVNTGIGQDLFIAIEDAGTLIVAYSSPFHGNRMIRVQPNNGSQSILCLGGLLARTLGIAVLPKTLTGNGS